MKNKYGKTKRGSFEVYIQDCQMDLTLLYQGWDGKSRTYDGASKDDRWFKTSYSSSKIPLSEIEIKVRPPRDTYTQHSVIELYPPSPIKYSSWANGSWEKQTTATKFNFFITSKEKHDKLLANLQKIKTYCTNRS